MLHAPGQQTCCSPSLQRWVSRGGLVPTIAYESQVLRSSCVAPLADVTGATVGPRRWVANSSDSRKSPGRSALAGNGCYLIAEVTGVEVIFVRRAREEEMCWWRSWVRMR